MALAHASPGRSRLMNLRRRRWAALAALGVGCAAVRAGAALQGQAGGRPDLPLDRQALVSRHDPVLRELDVEAPLSVGNGEFAFTADVTGLQTFAEPYDDTIPLATLSQWAWHTAPNPNGWRMEAFDHKTFESHGRPVGYADIPGDVRTPEIAWLRANPHRLHLGRIGFALTRPDGTPASAGDITDVQQTLVLWEGILRSRFRFGGQPVEVETLVHPSRDLLAVHVVSPLVRQQRIAVRLRFPYGTGHVHTADWTKPEAHHTVLMEQAATTARLERRLDADAYRVDAGWAPAARLHETAPHDFRLSPDTRGDGFDAVVEFTPAGAASPLPSFEAVRAETRDHWRRFWTSGGGRRSVAEHAIRAGASSSAASCSRSTSPPSSARQPARRRRPGLTFNTWEGKFHLEMHWWHAAHFALWDRLAAAREEPRRTTRPSCRGPRDRAAAGIRRRALAQDDRPNGRGVALVGRAVPRLAATAPDLLRGACRTARTPIARRSSASARSCSSPPSSWPRSRPGTRAAADSCSARRCSARRRSSRRTDRQLHVRAGLLAMGAGDGPEVARAPRAGARSEVGRGARPAGAARHGGRQYVFAETAPDSYTDPRWARDHPAVTGALGLLPGPGSIRPRCGARSTGSGSAGLGRTPGAGTIPWWP